MYLCIQSPRAAKRQTILYLLLPPSERKRSAELCLPAKALLGPLCICQILFRFFTALLISGSLLALPGASLSNPAPLSTILSAFFCVELFPRHLDCWTSDRYRYRYRYSCGCAAAFAFSSGESRSITRVVCVCTAVRTYVYGARTQTVFMLGQHNQTSSLCSPLLLAAFSGFLCFFWFSGFFASPFSVSSWPDQKFTICSVLRSPFSGLCSLFSLFIPLWFLGQNTAMGVRSSCLSSMELLRTELGLQIHVSTNCRQIASCSSCLP